MLLWVSLSPTTLRRGKGYEGNEEDGISEEVSEVVGWREMYPPRYMEEEVRRIMEEEKEEGNF